MKISDASGKLLETHHVVYSGLISWRLGKGIYNIELKLEDGHVINKRVLIK
jgi:hypothetical protein